MRNAFFLFFFVCLLLALFASQRWVRHRSSVEWGLLTRHYVQFFFVLINSFAPTFVELLVCAMCWCHCHIKSTYSPSSDTSVSMKWKVKAILDTHVLVHSQAHIDTHRYDWWKQKLIATATFATFFFNKFNLILPPFELNFHICFVVPQKLPSIDFFPSVISFTLCLPTYGASTSSNQSLRIE